MDLIRCWIRFDQGARSFKTALPKGPYWPSVVRRITRDARTGVIIKYAPHPKGHMVSAALSAPKDIVTHLIYCAQYHAYYNDVVASPVARMTHEKPMRNLLQNPKNRNSD